MDERDAQALDVVKLYYASGQSQSEIASQLGISRPTVSKLIQHAKDMGYVTIAINDPREDSSALAEQLAEVYELIDVRVAAPPMDSHDEVLRALGRTGARLLESLVLDGTMLGLSWGLTMYEVARNLQHQDRRGVEVIQLKGGMSQTATLTNDVETIHAFCDAFNAFGRYLPLPVIFDSVTVKELVETERHIANVLGLGRKADLAVFTVGSMEKDSMLMRLGYLSEAEMHEAQTRAVGDLCSRFIDIDGRPCLPDVNDRTVGIQLDELRALDRRVLVAGGRSKTEALDAALRAGYATHLVTDRFMAQRLVARHQ